MTYCESFNRLPNPDHEAERKRRVLDRVTASNADRSTLSMFEKYPFWFREKEKGFLLIPPQQEEETTEEFEARCHEAKCDTGGFQANEEEVRIYDAKMKDAKP